MKKLISVLSALFLLAVTDSAAQKVSVSTNMLDYACLGTMNADVSVSVARKWSLTAGARYNPFTFRKSDPERQFQYRQQSYSLGARFWPWYTMSGWWFASKVRWQEYNRGGILSPVTEEGDRYGMGLYAGYTYMLSPHFNLEFGAGLWSGVSYFRSYSCQVCGITINSGRKIFLLPDDLSISIAYVF